MDDRKQLKSRIAKLERRVKELEAQPREYHYHAPVYVPPFTPPAQPPWVGPWVSPLISPNTSPGIYIGDPPNPWGTITVGGASQ